MKILGFFGLRRSGVRERFLTVNLICIDTLPVLHAIVSIIWPSYITHHHFTNGWISKFATTQFCIDSSRLSGLPAFWSFGLSSSMHPESSRLWSSGVSLFVHSYHSIPWEFGTPGWFSSLFPLSDFRIGDFGTQNLPCFWFSGFASSGALLAQSLSSLGLRVQDLELSLFI